MLTATRPPTETKPTTPTIYKVSFGLGIASVFLGGMFGLLAWATVAVSGWALYSTREKQRRWLPWAGIALGFVFSIMNLYLNGHLDFVSEPAESAQAPQTETPELSTGEYESLGVSFGMLPFAWNSYDRIPFILYSDPDEIRDADGPFKVFKYDLGIAEVSGVFDSTDDSLYVLGITDLIVDGTYRESVVHLCTVLFTATGAEPCFDVVMQESGLAAYAGAIPSEIPALDAGWDFEGFTWESTYSDGVFSVTVHSF